MSRAAWAALLSLAITTGGCSCAGAPTFTVRSPRAEAPPAVAAPTGPFVRALNLADFGDATHQQGVLARAVVSEHRREPFGLALFAGDNVYECGPAADAPGAEACRFSDDGNTVATGSTDADPGFAQHEAPLAALAEPPAAEVFLALGNHDVATGGRCAGEGDPVEHARRKACLEVAHASPVWRMPGRHYAVDRGAARFVIIDSNLLKGDYGGFTLDAEVAFLREQAQGCRADACDAEPGGCRKPWCFVVAHHPPVTAGIHRDDATPDYLARVARLEEATRGRVRAWLAGHDHDLQHLRAPSGLDVFVSGNGARGRPRERFDAPSVPGTELLFASVRWGYGVVEVGTTGWRYAFHATDGAPLYCCATAAHSRCEPAACP